jgi:hypothetical protein
MLETYFSGDSNYAVLTIPSFVAKVYLEYKVADLNFRDPIDDQLVLYSDNGDNARYLFYNCYGGWDARTMYYNGSESQVTRRGATWPGDGIIGMAIDYTNKYVNFYYDNTLFGSVTLPNTTFRKVFIESSCEGRLHHELTVEQRLSKESITYPKDGFPCYLDALNVYSALHDIPTDTIRWYM